MLSSEAPQGVKISAYSLFAYGALNLLGFCAIIAIFGVEQSTGEELLGLGLAGVSIASCFILVFTILYAATGYGLLQLQSWARIAAIVLAILSLCSFPIGTILGGVVLYFMFQQEATQAFS